MQKDIYYKYILNKYLLVCVCVSPNLSKGVYCLRKVLGKNKNIFTIWLLVPRELLSEASRPHGAKSQQEHAESTRWAWRAG